MTRHQPHQCKGTKADGTPCRANTRTGSEYCFFHDPAKAEEQEAARQAGGRVGKTRVLPAETPDVPLSSVAEVVGLLGETINQLRRGEIDPRVANAVGYLSGTLLKALQQGDIEQRLADLEAIARHQESPESPFDVELEGARPDPEAEGKAVA
ncbi:MAG TPA: hypothetical protein VM238_13505 [Phycisphaerae bacterium]|nr:hypothetical protein [Phycisphaerae bacterium]